MRAISQLYVLTKSEQNFNIQMLGVEITAERISYQSRTNHRTTDSNQCVKKFVLLFIQLIIKIKIENNNIQLDTNSATLDILSSIFCRLYDARRNSIKRKRCSRKRTSIWSAWASTPPRSSLLWSAGARSNVTWHDKRTPISRAPLLSTFSPYHTLRLRYYSICSKSSKPTIRSGKTAHTLSLSRWLIENMVV